MGDLGVDMGVWGIWVEGKLGGGSTGRSGG